MEATMKPLLTAYARVFIVEGQARGDHKPDYMGCAKMGGISYGFGDVTAIECPSPTQYGKFIEVGQTKGATSRPTTTLTSRYMASIESTLLRVAKRGCALDFQVHIGACQNPSVFNDFDKAIILEGVQASNYGTDDLSAMSSDENNPVNETMDISAKDIYEVLKLSFSEKAGSAVTLELTDVVICDSISCGDCAEQSSGCEKIYAVSIAAGGSAGTPPDVVASVDGGITWFAQDVDSATTTDTLRGIACLGDYLIAVSDTTPYLHYTDKDTVIDPGDSSWSGAATGFHAGGGPMAIKSVGNKAFIVGKLGHVYLLDLDPAAGVTVLDDGVATTATLLAVDALDENFAVAVGMDGDIIKTENGDDWVAVGSPINHTNNILCVAVKSVNEWWIGSNYGGVGALSNGLLMYTTDGGVTWSNKTFSGTGTGNVQDIVFATPSVGYMSHTSTAGKGRIFRTYDGGYSWTMLPETQGSMPAADKFNALAACADDVNFVVGVGLADNATDGIVVLGAD
jgi:hypothetical protein